MDCEEIQARLNAYVDGELSPERRREVDQHLGACQGCRARIESLLQLGIALHDLQVPPVPEGFAARLGKVAERRAFRESQRKSGRRLRSGPVQWFAALSVPMRAAACGAVLLAFLLGSVLGGEVFVSSGREIPPPGTQSTFGLEWFGPTQPGSVGWAYLSFTSDSRAGGTR
jgi:anti-sigma factor RsiW